MNEYSSDESAPEIANAIKGAVIKDVSVKWDYSNPVLIFHFADDRALHIEYSWIYEWGVMDDARLHQS